MKHTVRASPGRWPLERVLFALAASVTLVSVALSTFVSPWFLVLSAFVGVNQALYVGLGACPASIVLKRTCGLESSIYPGNPASRTHAASNV